MCAQLLKTTGVDDRLSGKNSKKPYGGRVKHKKTVKLNCMSTKARHLNLAANAL